MRGDKGSLSSSVELPGKVDERGVDTGEDMEKPLSPFFRGDRKEDIREDVRD